MDDIHFKVIRIDGDYAILKRIDIQINTEIPLALALLPDGISEDTLLLYSNFEYEIEN